MSGRVWTIYTGEIPAGVMAGVPAESGPVRWCETCARIALGWRDPEGADPVRRELSRSSALALLGLHLDSAHPEALLLTPAAVPGCDECAMWTAHIAVHGPQSSIGCSGEAGHAERQHRLSHLIHQVSLPPR